MISASRFEGGSWVRVGFLLTYTAFAYGCVVVGAATLRRPRWRRPGIEGIAGVCATTALAALALPAIRFPDETLSGFRGLDALSVVIVVALVIVVVVGCVSSAHASLQLPAAACLVGVLAGNLLIQHFTTRGTSVEYGLWWATGAAAASLVAALGVRGRPEERR